MTNQIVDFTFGIRNQAMAVLHMLDRAPDFAEYKNGFYDVMIQTKPWYNGREGGAVISMRRPFDSKCIHISFFEHRNSDNICALKWVTGSFYFNHPLEDKNIFEVAYGGGSKYDTAYSVSYGEAGKMADWVYAQLEKFYKPAKPKVAA